MLKTAQDPTLFVTQPDHAQLAGYLAAHWGNADFASPGGYAPVASPERLRSETVRAIALHDNGWWEQDARIPPGTDGLPAGLAEILKVPEQGMERWRLGLRRFPETPYANLLISYHAYWLYGAVAMESANPAFLHPLFWKGSPKTLMQGAREQMEGFMTELQAMQRGWRETLIAKQETAAWIAPESLHPNARLLQILDGLSLYLTSSLIPPLRGPACGLGQDEVRLLEVPRRSWDDRVSLALRPLGEGRIQVSPFPFDLDPLPVTVPARSVRKPPKSPQDWHTWWHAQPLELLRFELVS
jgi:hypothetical protein